MELFGIKKKKTGTEINSTATPPPLKKQRRKDKKLTYSINIGMINNDLTICHQP